MRIRHTCSHLTAIAVLALPASRLGAQDHAGHHMERPGAGSPTQGGHAAFAAIAEVVKLLLADSTTDWSKVDLERLRQHLIDMDEVTLRARVTQTRVPGGLRIEVRGTSRTVEAIRRMTRAHAQTMQSDDPSIQSAIADVADGVVVTLTASRRGDASTEERIRGLGYIGWLTLSDHHAMHHLHIAQGRAGGHGP